LNFYLLSLPETLRILTAIRVTAIRVCTTHINAPDLKGYQGGKFKKKHNRWYLDE
jgi:hypothetical protein